MRALILGLILAMAMAAGVSVARAESAPPEKPQPPPHGPPFPGPPPPSHGLPGDPEHKGRPTRDPGMRPGIFSDVTEEQIQEILDFAGEHIPELRAYLERLREENPTYFRAYMRRLRFEIRQLRALRERDEAAFRTAIEEKRLRWQTRDLAARIRAAEDPQEKERLRRELRQTVGKLFDVELATQKAHIRRLEEQIEQLRENLKARAAQRDAIIEQRLEAAINPPPPPPAPGPGEREGKPPPPPGPLEPPPEGMRPVGDRAP